jgi:hypothetical protein
MTASGRSQRGTAKVAFEQTLSGVCRPSDLAARGSNQFEIRRLNHRRFGGLGAPTRPGPRQHFV